MKLADRYEQQLQLTSIINAKRTQPQTKYSNSDVLLKLIIFIITVITIIIVIIKTKIRQNKSKFRCLDFILIAANNLAKRAKAKLRSPSKKT